MMPVEEIPSGMFLLGLAILVLTLMRRIWRRHAGKRGRARKREPDSAAARARPMDTPVPVLRWEVAMHETARDLQAAMDSKAGVLNVLIRQAREETLRLTEVLRRAELAGVVPPGDPLALVERLGDDPRQDLATAVRAAATGGEDLLRRRRECCQQIYRLADRQQSAEAIARQVGATVGEVELVLSLRSGTTHPQTSRP